MSVTVLKSEYENLGIADFVVLDTETTGMSRGDEVIELALVDMDGTVLYESTFEPEVIINPFASRVNGFYNSDLEGAPLFKGEWENIKSAIGGKKLLGHNLSFDKRLIAQTLRRYDLDPTEVDSLFQDYYDSQYIAKRHLVAKSYSLENLAHQVGVTRPESHRAADDCLMTLEFLSKLEQILEDK